MPANTRKIRNVSNRCGRNPGAGLSDAEKSAVTDNASAIQLMQEKTSVIKRPVLVKDGQILHLGFTEAAYEELFSA